MPILQDVIDIPAGLRVKPGAMARVGDVCQAIALLARSRNKTVFFALNGIELSAQPSSLPHADALLAKEYKRKEKEREKRVSPAKRKAEKEKAKKKSDAVFRHIEDLRNKSVREPQAVVKWLIELSKLACGVKYDASVIQLYLMNAGWSCLRDNNRLRGESVKKWQKRIGAWGRFRRFIAKTIEYVIVHGVPQGKFENTAKRLLEELEKEKKKKPKVNVRSLWQSCSEMPGQGWRAVLDNGAMRFEPEPIRLERPPAEEGEVRSPIRPEEPEAQAVTVTLTATPTAATPRVMAFTDTAWGLGAATTYYWPVTGTGTGENR